MKAWMMGPLISLHSIAVSRGDGLRPEFLRLFHARAALSTRAVTELRPGKDIPQDQAGPNPSGNVESASRKGIVVFPDKQNAWKRKRGGGKKRCRRPL
ncbi:hypothetical protein SAMN03159463_05581 [Mesorhizobium sp. NFR06]|nr:hypothetical protein SAMN03159463_05581 [Mesorhizobium sp. NFR06]